MFLMLSVILVTEELTVTNFKHPLLTHLKSAASVSKHAFEPCHQSNLHKGPQGPNSSTQVKMMRGRW